MTTSEHINELATALAAAQAQLKPAAKEGHNPHFKSDYATLASTWEAARGPLTAHGLSIAQGCSSVPDFPERVVITTLLLHSSGQWLRDELVMSTGDGRPQSVGSAISYGRRYALAAIVGIAPEDDDAESAEGRSIAPKPTATVTAPKPAPKPTPRPNGARAMSQPPEPPPITDADIPF